MLNLKHAIVNTMPASKHAFELWARLLMLLSGREIEAGQHLFNIVPLATTKNENNIHIRILYILLWCWGVWAFSVLQ